MLRLLKTGKILKPKVIYPFMEAVLVVLEPAANIKKAQLFCLGVKARHCIYRIISKEGIGMLTLPSMFI